MNPLPQDGFSRVGESSLPLRAGAAGRSSSAFGMSDQRRLSPPQRVSPVKTYDDGPFRRPRSRMLTRSLWMCFALLLCTVVRASDFGWNPDLDAHKRFPSHAGFMAVHLIDNVETRWPEFAGWSGLVVRRVDGPTRRYTLQSVRTAFSSGQIFVGTLPAGDYLIERIWGGDLRAGASSRREAEAPEPLMAFRIEARRFTDVGTLVLHFGPAKKRNFTPLGWMTSFDGWWQRTPARPGLLGWFRASYPKLATLAPARRLYDPQSRSYVSAEQWAQLKPVALPDDEVLPNHGVGRRLDGGSLVLPGQFGQISMRAADGRWSTLYTGFSADINDVLELEDGWLIAGDRGLLAHSEPGASDWQMYADVPSDQAYDWLGRAGDQRIYALGHSQQRAVLMQLSSDRRRWTQVASFGARQGFRAGVDKRASVLGSDADALRIAVGAKRWRYHFADGQLMAAGKDRSVAGVRAQPNGALLATSGDDIATLDYLYSTDQGNSWTPIRRPSGLGNLAPALRDSSPYVDDQHRVLLIAPKVSRDSRLRIVASKDFHLQRSEAPRERMGWEAIVQMPAGCHHLLGSVSSDAELFVQCQDLSILRSSDGGKTWGLERSSAPAAAD